MTTFLRSFRGRLALWSAAVLLVGLAAFSFALGYANLSRVSGQIDRELRDRAFRFARGGPPVGLRLPMGPGPGDPAGPRPPMDRPFTGDPEGDRLMELRRPRFIGRDGRATNAFGQDSAFDPDALERIGPRRESMSQTTFEGERIRVFTTQWTMGGQQIGWVQVARDLRELEQLRRSQWIALLTLVPLALIVTGLGSYLLTGKALRPLAEMRAAAQSIGAGQLDRRLAVSGNDELADLATSFNEMVSRLQLSFEEQRAAYLALQEAYESQRRFTADASHELRTPLSRLQLATSSALAGPESGYRAAIEKADKAAQSMSKLVRQLLTLARADAGQLGLVREPLDLRLVGSNAANMVGRPVEVDLSSAPVTVLGDEDHLERVVVNLLENAIRHSPAEGKIVLRVGHDGAQAVLEVYDQGDGIPAEHIERVFERFYRADPSRTQSEGGSGLGLAICKSLVQAHGGSIGLKSDLGKGTVATVFLPLAGTS